MRFYDSVTVPFVQDCWSMIFYDSIWISRSSALVRHHSFLESSINPSMGSLLLYGHFHKTLNSTSTGILVVGQHWTHKLFLFWALMLLFFHGGWQWHLMGLSWEPRQALQTCMLSFGAVASFLVFSLAFTFWNVWWLILIVNQIGSRMT